MTGAALAYQNYCGTAGSPRVFSWYRHRDGKAYLQDQEGNWLSYDYAYNCLYMSYWMNAVAWKVEGRRLVRESDGAVVSYNAKQKWPLSDSKFLQALPISGDAVTVEVVAVKPSPMELLVPRMLPVYEHRHAPTSGDDVDRYSYGRRDPALDSSHDGKDPTRQVYAENKVAFFAVDGPVPGERTIPIYRLQRWSEPEKRVYYKLARSVSDAGYTLPPKHDGSPTFFAMDTDTDTEPAGPHLAQVYEHAATTPTSGLERYHYDLQPNASDGWGPGVPVFRAITVDAAKQALISSLGAESARRYATKWVEKFGADIGKLMQSVVSGKGKDGIDHSTVEQFQEFFQGMPRPKFHTLGAGAHAGYGLGAFGIELGSIWTTEEFGRIPAHPPVSDYSVEWVTFGPGTGVELGASVEAFAVGTWFGDLDQINGACNGVTISGQYLAGLCVTLLWDGTWAGANYGPHPIGVNVAVLAGVEAGAGVFYNASATQFWNHRFESMAKQLDPNCGPNFAVADGFVYFQAGNKGLYRVPCDGSGEAKQLDPNAGHLAVADDGFVYFQAGDKGLYRVPRDGSKAAERLDPNAGYLSVPGDGFVYFQAGTKGLYRVPCDGRGEAKQLDPSCERLVVPGDGFVYFQAGNKGLYRVPTDGSKPAQRLDPSCGNLVVPGDGFVYFQAGTKGLYRVPCDGSKEAQRLDPHCGNLAAPGDGYVYFEAPGRGLYRVAWDGSRAAEQLDPNCQQLTVGNDGFVYFQAGDKGLYRVPTDGKQGAQQIDIYCGNLLVDGGFVYFQAGPGRNALYRAPTTPPPPVKPIK